MKRIIFILTLLMLSVLGIFVSKGSLPNKLTAKPVVFISFNGIDRPESPGQIPKSFEAADLHERIKKLQNHQSQYSGSSEKVNSLYQKVSEIYSKFMSIANKIAKNLGASAVLDIGVCGDADSFVDPEYDITQKAIDQLNKEYKEYLKAQPKEAKQNPQKLLYDAILLDSKEDIAKAIIAGADIQKDFDGKKFLEWAVLYKKYYAVKTLLEYGAKANKALLETALKLNDVSSAILLAINCNADLDAIYSNGYQKGTLLELASNSENHKIIEDAFILLKNGASFSGYTIINCSPVGKIQLIAKIIWIATYNKDLALELLQLIIDRGYNVNDIWEATINFNWLYCDYQKEILELFIKNGANPNKIIYKKIPVGCNWTPLFKAIENDSLEIVEILLNAGAHINQKANPDTHQPSLCLTPLSFAINKGNIGIAEFLRKHGASL